MVLPFATLKMFPGLQNCSVHNTRSATGTCKVIDMDGSFHIVLISMVFSHFSYFQKENLKYLSEW
jgi:hypothetical protein